MTLNLWAQNDRSDLVEKLVQAESPDVILLVEGHTALARPVAASPRPLSLCRADARRSEPAKHAAQPLAREGRARPAPGIEGKADDRRDDLPGPDWRRGERLCPCHWPAYRPAAAASRNSQLAALAGLITSQAERRVIVMGDFNLTPWSRYFRRFLDDAHLSDSAAGRGVAPTWFSRLIPFGLPIDQVLLGSDVDVVDRHVGADVGSDHLPVIADLAF